MIDHLWHERMPVADVMIRFGPSDNGGFQLAILREKLRISLKARLRSLWIRLRKSKDN